MLGNLKFKIKNSKFLLLFLVFMLFDSKIIYSQEFNLKEAVDYALEHNPNILIAKNKIEKAKVILRDSERLLDLNINVQFGYGPLTDRKGIGFGVSCDLDRLLGRNKKEKNLAQLDLNSASWEFVTIQQQVTRQVIEAFNNLESAKRFLRLKEEAHTDSKKSLEFAQEKFNLGTISMDEFLAKQQSLKQSEFEFQQAEKELKKASLIFYQAIGYKEEPTPLDSRHLTGRAD